MGEYYDPGKYRAHLPHCVYQKNICSIKDRSTNFGTRTVFRQPWIDCSCPAHAINNVRGTCVVKNITDLVKKVDPERKEDDVPQCSGERKPAVKAFNLIYKKKGKRKFTRKDVEQVDDFSELLANQHRYKAGFGSAKQMDSNNGHMIALTLNPNDSLSIVNGIMCKGKKNKDVSVAIDAVDSKTMKLPCNYKLDHRFMMLKKRNAPPRINIKKTEKPVNEKDRIVLD